MNVSSPAARMSSRSRRESVETCHEPLGAGLPARRAESRARAGADALNSGLRGDRRGLGDVISTSRLVAPPHRRRSRCSRRLEVGGRPTVDELRRRVRERAELRTAETPPAGAGSRQAASAGIDGIACSAEESAVSVGARRRGQDSGRREAEAAAGRDRRVADVAGAGRCLRPTSCRRAPRSRRRRGPRPLPSAAFRAKRLKATLRAPFSRSIARRRWPPFPTSAEVVTATAAPSTERPPPSLRLRCRDHVLGSSGPARRQRMPPPSQHWSSR